MIETRFYRHIDWALLAAVLAICVLGVSMVYSATVTPDGGASRLVRTQVYAILLGLGAMLHRQASRSHCRPSCSRRSSRSWG